MSTDIEHLKQTPVSHSKTLGEASFHKLYNNSLKHLWVGQAVTKEDTHSPARNAWFINTTIITTSGVLCSKTRTIQPHMNINKKQYHYITYNKTSITQMKPLAAEDNNRGEATRALSHEQNHTFKTNL